MLNKAKNEGKVVMLELGSVGCIPCEQMKPVMEKLRTNYMSKLEVIFIDVQKDRDSGRKFGVAMIREFTALCLCLWALRTHFFRRVINRHNRKHYKFKGNEKFLCVFEKNQWLLARSCRNVPDHNIYLMTDIKVRVCKSTPYVFLVISKSIKTLEKRIHRTVMMLILLVMILFLCNPVYASETTAQEGVCTPDKENVPECRDIPTSPTDKLIFTGPEEKKTFEIPLPSKGEPSLREEKKTVEKEPKKTAVEINKFIVYFFWGKGCQHCDEEKAFLEEMKKKYINMQIKDYEVWYNKQNAILLSQMTDAYKIKVSGVPVTFVGENAFVGFSKQSKEEIETAIHNCTIRKCIKPTEKKIEVPVVPEKAFIEKSESEKEKTRKTDEKKFEDEDKTVTIPLVGKLDATNISLPFITLVIAGFDGFNPCAFFVLLSLLGLLVHAQSRRKMLLIGGVFVFFSGFIYFVFMAAWLNLFLFMGQVAIITKIAGAVSVVIAVINIKDFFAFKKGISLTIPDSAKPKLFDRMRKLMKSTSILSILVGTAVLAVTANTYELLCTAGFPMVFTRILTLNDLSTLSYYLYLVLYNVIYVVPLSVIVLVFTVTLGKKKLTEWQGRVLKLISGTMMLGLGVVLILNPALLNNILVSIILLSVALAVSTAVVFFIRKLGCSL
ncbi:MAG: hypothetical protein L6246_06210 [Thermodesulfovibrionales bacterium]|nr:hypothetical protein [Thermodesulfovibrionales bacterium]